MVATKMNKPKRMWRYRVDRAWGDWLDRDIVGQVVVDTYRRGGRYWNFMNTNTGKATGGFHGVLIDEYRGA